MTSLAERRPKFRAGLSALYLPFYDKLCAEMGPYWQPFYGLRTFAEQDALYAQGRSVPGSIVTNAKGGESPHNYGCASDWTLWDVSGNPIWMTAKDDRWKTYIDAIAKVGLYSGSLFTDVDFPHNELHIQVSWPKVLTAVQAGTNAEDFISPRMW